MRASLESESYQRALDAVATLKNARLLKDLQDLAHGYSSLALAGAALVQDGDPVEAKRLAELARADVRTATQLGKSDEAWLTERLVALATRAERERRVKVVSAAVQHARQGKRDWSEVHALAAAARRDLAAQVRTDDPQLDATLKNLQDVSRQSTYEEALAKAETVLEELRGGDADLVKARLAERAARKALRHVAPAELPQVAALLHAYAQALQTLGEKEARETIRSGLRSLPGAERAWLALEESHARAEVRIGERLIPRSEDVTLGEASVYRDNPPHRVSLPPYYIDATEVSVSAYAKAVAAGHVPPPVDWIGAQPPEDSARMPVRNVSFADSVRYAEAVGKRLPSADEWEVAAAVRALTPGGPHRTFPWGPDWNPLAGLELRPVGSQRADVSSHGALDMGGNVTEWATTRDTEGKTVPCAKGGAHAFVPELLPGYQDLFRSTHRNHAIGEPLPFCGFRCARNVPALDLKEMVLK